MVHNNEEIRGRLSEYIPTACLAIISLTLPDWSSKLRMSLNLELQKEDLRLVEHDIS